MIPTGKKHNKQAFTLVELLVALSVTAVILAAVAGLTFAVSSANQASGNTADIQARIRFATVHISELLRHCRLVCGSADNDLCLWRADDNQNGRIDADELVFIEAGANRDFLRIVKYPYTHYGTAFLPSLLDGSLKGTLHSSASERVTTLLTDCSNVRFRLDVAPPETQFVCIDFDVTENNRSSHYQINARLRSWAGHLLRGPGMADYDDDE